MLLLAGQANSHHWWDGLREDFEDRYRVVTLDQRGTGSSLGPVGDWTTRLFAADAASVLEELLGLDDAPAHVYGTSMGGRVGQHLAADYP
ncbi:MAG: alpha/beta fold hydrolase, partial [Actinomycetes bacterium]